MKKILFSILVLSTLTTGAFAQLKTGLKTMPAIFKDFKRPAYRQLLGKLNETLAQQNRQSKQAVKLPVLIYTQAWDTAAQQFTDTTEKYILAWDNQKNLQSITDISMDPSAGNTKTIESGFVKFATPMAVDNNISVNYFPSLVITQVQANGNYVNDTKEMVSFDAFQRIALVIEQKWDKNAWANSMKYEFSYDAYGNLSGMFFYTAAGASWTLTQGIKESFSFDKKGFITQVLQSQSNGGAYQDYAKENYVLDGNGAIKSALISYIDGTADWVKYDSVSNISWLHFDPIMRLNLSNGGTVGILAAGGDKYLGYIETNYDNTIQAWGTSEKHTFTYNKDSLPVNVLVQDQINNTWINATDDTTTYYPQGDVKTFLSRYWNNGWFNNSLGSNNVNTYDADNDISESIVQTQDPIDANKFVNANKTEYAYAGNSGIAAIAVAGNSVVPYPNPASDKLFFDFGATPWPNCNIGIMDIKGKLISQKTYSNNGGNISIDVSQLQAGPYFVSVTNGSSVSYYEFLKK